MSAFEFTPGGVQPLTDAPATGVIPAGEAIRSLRAQVDASEAARVVPPTKSSKTQLSSAPLTRKSFLPELRARQRVVRAELKRMRGLEDEDAELSRLIAAAKAPPAHVTPITNARKSG